MPTLTSLLSPATRPVKSGVVLGRVGRGRYSIKLDSGEFVAAAVLGQDTYLSPGAKILVAEIDGNYRIIGGEGYTTRQILEVNVEG